MKICSVVSIIWLLFLRATERTITNEKRVTLSNYEYEYFKFVLTRI